MKRFVDVLLSVLMLILLAPFILLIALFIRVDAGGPVLVLTHRVGKSGRMLKVYEFRTAIADADALETVAGCHGEQITRTGTLLRRFGVVRWPMLINVLRGELSIVGPRAEMPRYVGCYPTAVRKSVLSIKPGLLDLASISFNGEARLLAGLKDAELEEAYVEKVLPIRLDYAQQYVAQRGFWMDVRILVWSVVQLFWPFGLRSN